MIKGLLAGVVLAVAARAIYKGLRKREGKLLIDVADTQMDESVESMSLKRYPWFGNLLDGALFSPAKKVFGMIKPDHSWVTLGVSNGRFLCLQKDWDGNVYLTSHKTEREADSSTFPPNKTPAVTPCRSMPTQWDMRVRDVVKWIKNRPRDYRIFTSNCQTLAADFVDQHNININRRR